MKTHLFTKSGAHLEQAPILFPGGEVGARISQTAFRAINEAGSVNIRVSLQSGRDIIELVMLNDAIARACPNTAQHLQMPYIPYARQDRVCNKGEAHGAKVFCELINNCGFETVQVADPHSEVSVALLERSSSLSITDILIHEGIFVSAARNSLLVSPDAGANKKVAHLAGCLDHKKFIRADKLRNLATGDILETVVYDDDIEGLEVIIVDDICDGGRTFTELAKVLKSKGASKVSLYVTHGIFSKGLDVIFDSGIDQIFTTDSLSAPEGYTPTNFKTIPLKFKTY